MGLKTRARRCHSHALSSTLQTCRLCLRPVCAGTVSTGGVHHDPSGQWPFLCILACHHASIAVIDGVNSPADLAAMLLWVAILPGCMASALPHDLIIARLPMTVLLLGAIATDLADVRCDSFTAAIPAAVCSTVHAGIDDMPPNPCAYRLRLWYRAILARGHRRSSWLWRLSKRDSTPVQAGT